MFASNVLHTCTSFYHCRFLQLMGNVWPRSNSDFLLFTKKLTCSCMTKNGISLIMKVKRFQMYEHNAGKPVSSLYYVSTILLFCNMT